MKLPLLFALTVVLSIAVGYGIARWQMSKERHHGHELKARGGFVRPLTTPYTLPPLDDEVTVIRHFPCCSMVKLTKEEHRRIHQPIQLNITPIDEEHYKNLENAIGVLSCRDE